MEVIHNRAVLEGKPKAIGVILIDNGRIQPHDAEKILKLQKSEPGLRFGDAAVRLGLLSREDVQQALAEQFVYPYLSASDRHISQSVVAAFNPFCEFVEQMRVLRSQLLIRWFNATGNKSIAIVSPESGDGKSFVAANLAVVFSQLGEKTLLIDADLRSSDQHRLFRLKSKAGLSTVLAGRSDLAESITPISGLLGLSVLGAGPTPPNPHELLSRKVFDELIRECQTHYDVVIIDTPAGLQFSDTHSIASRSIGAMVVGRKNVTSVSGMQKLTQQLQDNDVTVVGSVLNNGS